MFEGEGRISEKTHVYSVALFEVILGVLQLIIGATMLSFYTYWLMMIANIGRAAYMYSPDYLTGMLGAGGSIILFVGIYVLIHAVRRIIDHGLAAYIASKKLGMILTPSYPVRHCIYCGAEIPGGATFCAKCGKKQGKFE